VQRQYTGTAGRIENAQVAVYLGYAAPRGHALIDRELYLPKSWTDDRDRCAAAGIPATVTFATKPQLAKRMIERAAGAAVPFAWVAGDEVYGDNGPLRTWLETRRIAHVLAVARDHRVPAGAGRTLRADQLAARLPGKAWQQLSAGAGAKGHRWYDWAWVTINHPRTGTPVPADPPQPPHRRPGLLPLLQPAAGHASRPGHGRRAPLDHRGEFPGRQCVHCHCAFFPSGVLEESSLAGFYLDTQAAAASAADVHGGEFAALDLMQNGLPGDAEGGGGLL
jgi:DDE superfamily endonuclease